MRTNLLTHIIAFVSVFTVLVAQAQTTSVNEREGRNLLKVNMLTLVGGKFSLEYERLLTDRITVGAAISLRPDKGLPFTSTVKRIVDDEDINTLIDGFSSSNFSITPELRFYTSERGPFRGFYVAPYVKYASYATSLPYEFDVTVDYEGIELYNRKETIPLQGDIRSFTAGLSFGVNFKLARHIHLDWRILGPGYGSAKGDISGRLALNAQEQTALRESLADLKTDLADLPLGIEIDYDVHQDGAEIKVLRSPWAGIRSGLSIAYRF